MEHDGNPMTFFADRTPELPRDEWIERELDARQHLIGSDGAARERARRGANEYLDRDKQEMRDLVERTKETQKEMIIKADARDIDSFGRYWLEMKILRHQQARLRRIGTMVDRQAQRQDAAIDRVVRDAVRERPARRGRDQGRER